MKLLSKKLLTREGIDKKLATIIAAIGIISLILTTVVFPSLLFMQASATLLLASAIYLFLRWRRRRVQVEESPAEGRDARLLPPHLSKLLDIAFWGLLIAGLIVISHGVYARPLSFLILVSIMSSILAVQIFTGKNTAYCVIKIVTIGILLRASAWYQFPSPVGYDSVAEVNFLEQLVATGHTGGFMMGYEYYPIAFYFTASTAVITGMEAINAHFILGVIEVIGLIFVFLIGKHFFNEKIGLLAALIIAVFDWHVFWGFYVKAFTLGIAWVSIVLFLLLTAQQKNRLVFLVLSILLMFLLILTHTVPPTVLLVILLIGWLLFLLLRNIQSKEKFELPIKLNIVLLLFCATLAYWMYVSGFHRYIAYAINYALSLDIGKMVVFTLPTSTAEVIWSRLPIFALIFFATLGCLSIFNIRKWDSKALLQVWLAVLCGALVIINFIIFYAPELGTMLKERWFVFVGLIMAIPAAIGLLSIPSKKGWQSLAVLFLLMFALSGIMTTSYIGSVDTVIPWGPQSHSAATSSELAAAETVSRMAGLTADHTPTGETRIYADHYYSQIFRYDVHVPEDKLVDLIELQKEELKEYHGILILRSAVIDVVSVKEELIMDLSQYQSLMSDPQVILIYDSGTVKALRRP